MRARRTIQALASAAVLACGCNSILGIQQKDYTPDAGAMGSDDAMSGDATSEDGHPGDAREEDGQGSPQDAAKDVTYPSCASDASAGAVCGPVTDGAWSMCSYAAICDDSGSRTRSVMTPTCVAGACKVVTTTETDMPGCARNTDGTTCGTGQACSGQVCKCAPACAGRNCGSDSCGGTCGSCSGSNSSCNGSGVCVCTPTAGCVGGGNVGNVCGADDGCGGPCTCDTANGESCVSSVCCHNPTWFCTSNAQCCSGSCNIGPNVCN